MVGKETIEKVHRLRPAATLPAPAPPLDDHHTLEQRTFGARERLRHRW